jgi:capsular polysaccharide biosynthesis protein/NAD(P)-dependent dehydrogenase (short-subunit alcohol dehydrogenase family)
MHGTTQASSDDIDITSIWGSLRRSGKSLLLASLFTGGLTYAVLSMTVPHYASESQLTMAAKNASNPFNDTMDGTRAPDSVNVLVDPAAVNTHVRALKSPELATRVANELKLNTMPEFNSALGSTDKIDAVLRTVGLSGPPPGETEQDRVLNAFFKRLELYAAEKSRLIGVRLTSNDSALASEVANHLNSAYRASLTEKTVEEIGEVQKVVEDVAKSKQNELDRALKDLEEAKLKTRTRVVPIELKILSKAMPSSVPVFPEKGPLTALVVLATLLFGIAWGVTRALLSSARANANGPYPMRRASDRDLSAGGLAGSKSAPVHEMTRGQPAFHNEPAADTSDITLDNNGTAEIASVAKLARHIRAHSSQGGGFRTLISAGTNGIDVSVEGLALAEELARDGLQTIVVDWSVDESGFADRVGLSVSPGFNDLALGDASFEDVIHSLPDGQVHIVPSGTSLGGASVDHAIDPEKLNLLLDALDEAYEQIIVVAKSTDARALFEAIQGRFDAGVMVNAGARTTAVLQDPPGTFLGFEVTDITLVRYNRLDDNPQGTQRIVRRGLPGGTEAHI